MHTPARILRAQCDDIPGQRPPPSYREEETRARIMDCAQRLMANNGAAAIRLTDFALAMRAAPRTIRRHFPDMHNLLAQILHRHLQAIVRALAEIPRDAPNRDARRRAAYLAFTRTPFGAPTEAHLLLIRDRHLLPPDEREPLEAHRLSLGDILAGSQAIPALALLDTPELAPAEIEAALAAIAQPQAAPSPRPHIHAPIPALQTPIPSPTCQRAPKRPPRHRRENQPLPKPRWNPATAAREHDTN